MESKCATVAGVRYEFVQLVAHAGGGEMIALLRSCDTGEPCYLRLDEWERIEASPRRSTTHPSGSNAVSMPIKPEKLPADPPAGVVSGPHDPTPAKVLPHLKTLPAVTRSSSISEKTALFRSLFKGRDDVYAHGYTNRKTGKIGYGPVCANRRNRNICQLGRGVKCRDCEYRAFVPIDDDAIHAHFRGLSDRFEDVIGLYVLDDDCRTWVLAADFDDGNWQAEAAAYRDAARAQGLDPAVERSRSGEGAHVWIFFETPIDAQLARNLGFSIITAAMRTSEMMDFSSYDRLFPAQSTVQPGGLGNLIALPLQGRAVRQGNSLFVDDEFLPMPDQMAYLSSVRKATAAHVQEIVNHENERANSHTACNSCEPASSHANNHIEGGMHDTSAVISPASTSSMPASIRIVKSNGLHVRTVGLPAALKDRMRRLAVFANPNFHRAQATHRSVYGTPHFIWLYEENEHEIHLPRGCEADLIKLLRAHGITPDVADDRPTPLRINVRLQGELRADQQEALAAITAYENGILSAPTGYGKTVIGAGLIAHQQVRTLVIVPRSALVDQWRNSLERFLDLQEELPTLFTKTGRRRKNQPSIIGHIGSSQHPANGMIDVATFQSLTEPGDISGTRRVKDLVHGYDMIICDECHYCAADKLQLILRSVQARYVYGLSATPRRTDGLERMIYLQCGPIRFAVDPKVQSAVQHFRRLLIPRFTRIRIPDIEPATPFNSILDRLCDHIARNDQIVQDTARTLADGRTPLVITRRVEHAELLALRLKQLGHTAFLLTGAGTHRERHDALAAVRAHPGNQPFAIVATGSYIGEGFDEPRLDTLVLATPAASEIIVTQYSGRLHREHAGKSEVIVYDYVDATVPMLDQMYRKRLRTYRKLGYEVATEIADGEPIGRFVEPGDCAKTLISDISASSKSVHISPIYINPRFLQLVIPALTDAHARGIVISVCIKQPKNDDSLQRVLKAAAALEASGCTVHMAQSGRFGLAVFDEKIVWYGNLPLLAFGKREDCSLRFESTEVAYDLLAERGANTPRP